jgi:hypothetical protein
MSTSPAGWQPDPRGRHEYRYWDGSKWTDHVSDKGVVSSDPVADETPAEPAAEEQATQIRSTMSEPSEQATQIRSTMSEPESAPAPAPEPAAAPPAAEQPVAASAPAASQPATTPPAGGSAPPPGAGSSSTPASSGSAAAETAKAEVQAALSAKSPDLAVLLSVIAPGSGHLYLGVEPAKRNIAFGLLGATVVAVVLAYFSMILFIVGFVIWAAAAFYAVNDLRGGAGREALENASIPQQFVGILLVVGGALLIVSLFLPWYHIKASLGGVSRGDSFSGFTVLDIIDIVLLVIGVLAIVGGLVAMGIIGGSNMPDQLPVAVAIAGAIAFVLVVFRMFIDSVPDTEAAFGPKVDVSIGRAPGILLAADAAIILVMANLSTLKSLKK